MSDVISLRDWVGRTTEFHLTAEDIQTMYEGETMEVILLDRNIGDYMADCKSGTDYYPTEMGLNYATYTHISGLSGTIKFRRSDEPASPFQWEINLSAIDPSLMYWGPFEIMSIPPSTRVGWRGPCLKMSDALEYLPSKVTHYCDLRDYPAY